MKMEVTVSFNAEFYQKFWIKSVNTLSMRCQIFDFNNTKIILLEGTSLKSLKFLHIPLKLHMPFLTKKVKIQKIN